MHMISDAFDALRDRPWPLRRSQGNGLHRIKSLDSLVRVRRGLQAWPRARGVAWIILSAFEADDGGSNPPGPATHYGRRTIWTVASMQVTSLERSPI